MRVIISGGGTGGHIYPAIAIAQKLEQEISNTEIVYVGIKGGPEENIAKKYGYKFIDLPGMGIPRRINKKLFKALVKNLEGFRKAKKIIKEYKPDLVVGTGGYVCAPILYQASRAKIPCLVHESNSYPGIASKFLSNKVDRVLISYKEAEKHFKHKDNIIVTGNPVRTNFKLTYSEKDLKKLGIKKDRPVVFSFGGSNGSYFMNEAVKDLSKIMDGSYYLLHQTGARYYDDFIKESKDNPYLKVFSYIDNIDLFYAVSDLVIASSGAMSLSEISSVGKASILIPKSYTTENHQQFNAQTYVDNGASEMILEKDLTGDILNQKIREIVSDSNKLKHMGENAWKLSSNDAGDRILGVIKELVNYEGK
ncbi:undecaprenyldiphospho-muramoylpentapeptide beta-N-acetylglucosaminyltransferase [uncultured Anaerococcus sp.]|uniref:undecaprenyldiphospho-muramoylpentapeptide beta-N-acetylglucosaminyltransferase n=1 Tax=uncultured Anaerococcus sp. TaxID=293428 RepID=UPI002612B446|nr:undecaprenyldiphospho-muramoylpentapeptide beta-N-acetylglucosaminyltransferase [uncultured Anaerococcus sp.]